MMKQTRIDSFMESVTNTFIGWFVSLLTWLVVAWWMNIPMTWGESLLITGIFTAVSVIRSYTLRRVFNGRLPWRAIRSFNLRSSIRESRSCVRLLAVSVILAAPLWVVIIAVYDLREAGFGRDVRFFFADAWDVLVSGRFN